VKAFPLSNRELAQPKHGLSRQLAGPPINYVTSPPRILLQESRDSSLYAKTIYHSQWRNWRGAEERIHPPLAIWMWKPDRHLKWYFGFSIRLAFSRLLFLRAFRFIFRWFRV